MTHPKILFDSVTHRFQPAGRSIEALRDFTLGIEAGEIVCILGPSGCGKTTLLNLLAGFFAPTSGSVLLDGHNVRGPGAERAMVFQEDALFPWLTVESNLAYGPRARGVPAAQRESIVDRLLEKVRLEPVRKLLPRQLSGGMKKRTDLARAYANEPDVLLMDEPFGALDMPTKQAMQCELLRLTSANDVTVVFVTHDIEEAIFVGGRIVVLTPRPAQILKSLPVALDKTTDYRVRTSTSFQKLRLEIDSLVQSQETEGSR